MIAVAKPIMVTGVITVLLCLGHFFNAVYVPLKDEQRLSNIATLPVTTLALPYQPDELKSTIAKWFIPNDNAASATEPVTALLDGFDNTVLGDTTVALLAIYQLKQPVAVLALQQVGQSVSYVSLAKGDSTSNIQLSHISPRAVTLSYQDKQVQLKLFTPASAVTE